MANNKKNKINLEQVKNLSIGVLIILGSISVTIFLIWFFIFLGDIYGDWRNKIETKQALLTTQSYAEQDLLLAKSKAESNRIIRESLGGKTSFISYLKATKSCEK